MSDLVDQLNDFPGWMHVLGIRLTSAGPDEVTCEWDVDSRHHQRYGIVHGGVHAGVIEDLCSVGAALSAARNQQLVVGLENNTSFVRAARGGRLHARAAPLTRGRRSQLWECRVWDSEERLVAVGRVRLLCLESDHDLAGGSGFVVEPESAG